MKIITETVFFTFKESRNMKDGDMNPGDSSINVLFRKSVCKLNNVMQSRDGIFLTFKEPRIRCQGIDSAGLCSLAGRYDYPIPSPFLAP